MPIRHTAAVNPSLRVDLCFRPAAQILIACRAHPRVDQSTHSAGSIHRHQGAGTGSIDSLDWSSPGPD
eukprot:2292189-Prymnesium_polylepis.1